MSRKKVRLLDDGEKVEDTLTVNRSFAETFERKKRREEIQKAKAKAKELGIDLEEGEDESSSTSEDEDAELLNDTVDAKFLKVMSLIKNKDPRLKDPDFHMFSDSDFEEEDENSAVKKREEKPVLYKDLHIQTLLTEGPEATEGNDPVIEVPVQEQHRIKSEFLQAVDDWEQKDGSSEVLLKRRKKTAEEENVTLPLLPTDGETDLAAVQDYWTKPETKEDAYLKKFILKKEWQEEEPELMTYDEVVDVEDRKRDQEMELFELAYNYRFEEEGFERIKTYARGVSDSVRVKSDARKQQRDAKKERKDLEKKHKVEEIKRFKNLKKQEIMDRLNTINTFAGVDTHIKPEALESDFDPVAHDQEMAKIFDDEYYQQKEHKSDLQITEDLVPDNDDHTNDIDIKRIEEETDLPTALKIGGQGDWWLCDNCHQPVPAGSIRFDCLECDNYTLCEMCRETTDHEHRLKRLRVPKICAPPEHYIAICCNECGIDVTGARRYDCKVCKDYTLCATCKETGKHPHPVRCLEDELWQDYYDLDYEDVVGGVPCRFRYRNVPEEDYGLEDEEILTWDDKTLNSLVSLKKLAPYREDEGKVNRSSIRKKVKWLRKQRSKAKHISAVPVSDPAEERLKSYGLLE